MPHRPFLQLLGGLALWLSSTAGALPSYITFPADIDWVTRDSPHFHVVYSKGHDHFAARVLVHAEAAFRKLSPIFPPGPDKTWIVISDFVDSMNGYSLDLPWPHIVLFAVPPEPSGELAWLDNWLASLILHEYTHTLHIYPASGLWKLARSVLGSWILPNGLLPTHLHEGVATLCETKLTGGGRGNGTYFKMIRRMSVLAGRWNRDAHPLDRMDGAPSLWPGGTSAYLFGYNLYDELWQRKGPQGIHDLTAAYSANWPYFFQDVPLEDVYGTDYATLWDEIFRKTGESEKSEIARIESTPLSPLEYLTSSRFTKVDIAVSPDQKRAIYRKGTPSEGGSFELLDLGTGKVLDNLRLGAGSVNGMCWGKTPKGERLLFLRNDGKSLHSVTHLAVFDLGKKRSARMTREDKKELEHLHLLGCSPDLGHLLVYRERDGEGEIEALTWNGEYQPKAEAPEQRHWQLPEDRWISGLLVGTPDWFLLRQGTMTALYRWEPGKDPVSVLELKGHAYNLRPGRHPNELFVIAAFDGRDEIWTLDTVQMTAHKEVGILGGTNSFVARDADFILTSYRDGGYDIAKATPLTGQNVRVLPTPSPQRETSSEQATTLTEPHPYSALGTLYPRMWIPSLLIVPNGLQIGAYIPGFDITQKHLYDLAGGYDTRGQFFGFGDYTYRYSNRLSVLSTAYYAPAYLYTYESFLKQWGGNVAAAWELGSFLPQLSVGPTFRRMESSSLFGPANQSVGVSVSAQWGGGVKQLPLEISPSKGTLVSLNYSQYLQAMGSNDNYFVATAGIDQFISAPWLNGHSFYIALRGGYTQGTTIYNSYFESGGDLLFYEYREYFLNRGFAYLQFPFSRRILNLNLEYRFPIARIEHGIALWPVFLEGIYGSVVSDTTTRDLGVGRDYQNTSDLFYYYYPSVGFELKTDWIWSYYLPGQITFGAYHGFGPLGQEIYMSMGMSAEI